MPRNLRVRPSPGASLFGGIVASVFVVIGMTNVIPDAGGFGVLWTLGALAAAIVNFYNAFSERGIASEIVEMPDEKPLNSGDVETRLGRLEELRKKSLVTAAEYQKRREEILREI